MQVLCPKCDTLNPIRNKHCANCGTSLRHAKIVKEVQTDEVKAQRKRSNMALWIVLAIIIICGLVYGVARSRNSNGTPAHILSTSAPAQFVHLDGYNPGTGNVEVRNINLWEDYNTRVGIAGVGHHGGRVKLIRRSGDGCLIQLSSGVQGWVTCEYFIKEYK
ncbi:MAG: hypothetical protein ACK2UC_01590 [Anaerolineae bacterium]|jgi:ribosomal protein L40E